MNECYISIDKKGNSIFSIDATDVSQVYPFENNCSFIEKNNIIYQIDINGEIIKSYTLSDNTEVKVCAEGQIWIQEYESDFDNAGYIYTLYGADGEKLTAFSVEGTDPIDSIYCCGKGVWRYDTHNNNGDSVQKYYCTKNNKWVETMVTTNDEPYFYDDLCIIGIEHIDPDETGYRAKMTIMDIEGNFKEVKIPKDLGWKWSDKTYIKDGYCILKSSIYPEDYIVSYNVSTNEFKKMDNKYADKIIIDAIPDKLMFINGCVALPLKGTDEENYVGLFDTSWNIIGEPISSIKFAFSEDRLIVSYFSPKDENGSFQNMLAVYDTKGKIVFQPSEKDYVSLMNYEDGISYVLTSDVSDLVRSAAGRYSYLLTSNEFSGLEMSSDWKCIDINGEYLFDEINIDQLKEIEIK